MFQFHIFNNLNIINYNFVGYVFFNSPQQLQCCTKIFNSTSFDPWCNTHTPNTFTHKTHKFQVPYFLFFALFQSYNWLIAKFKKFCIGDKFPTLFLFLIVYYIFAKGYMALKTQGLTSLSSNLPQLKYYFFLCS